MDALTAQELWELRWHWQDAYEIDCDPWRAARRDDGRQLQADSSEELLTAIRADYNARPVPRGLSH